MELTEVEATWLSVVALVQSILIKFAFLLERIHLVQIYSLALF